MVQESGERECDEDEAMRRGEHWPVWPALPLLLSL